jgi:RNA polymerase sigma factor (sigma-70 family)
MRQAITLVNFTARRTAPARRAHLRVRRSMSAAVVTLPMQDDEQLLARYINGDTLAFNALYQRHRAPLWRYLTRLLGSSAIGEELYQEVWQKVIQQRTQFSGAPFKPWLYRVAHNLALDQMRRNAKAPMQSLDDMVLSFPNVLDSHRSDDSPEALQLDDEAHQRLLSALAELPPEQRDVVLMKAEGELTLEQIGELTGQGRETVKSRLRYALAKLKGVLS